MTHMPSRESRRKGLPFGGFRWGLSATTLALVSFFQSCQPAHAQSPAVCVVSGTVLDGGSQPIVGTQVRFRVISPVMSGSAAIATQDLTTVTAAGGAWSLTLIQGLNAQVDIPAVGIQKDTVIPTGGLCPAAFTSLTLYNRGTLTPATILSTAGPSMGGDLMGSSPNPTVVGLRGQTLAAGACTNGQARVYSSGSSSYTCQNVTAGTSVTSITGGTAVTVSGTATVPIVGVTAGAITNTQLGTGAAAANLGAAGGALTGTYPSPTLATGVAATNVGTLGGDLSGTLPNPTVATVGAQTAANVAAGAVLANAATTANTPSTIVKRDGGGAFTAGNITGTFLGNATTATTLSSTLTGDASSSGNAVTVTGLRGRPVNAAAPSTGNALTWSGTDWAPAAAVGTVTSVAAAGGGTGLSFSGSPITGAGTLTLQGTLGIGFGGTGATTVAGAFDALSPMTTLGDVIYGGASGTRTRLAGNTTTTAMALFSTGSAGLATAPAWRALVSGDIPASISSNTSGTAAGLSATLAVGSGGTGQTSASAAFNALSPTTTTGDTIYANGAGTNTRLAGNVTTTKNFMVQTGNGATSNAPAWGTIVSGDLPASIAANTSGTAAGLSSTLVVASGGSGAATFGAGVLHASGTSPFTSSPVALGSEVSGTLPVGSGGTGQTTAGAAYNALSPTTTAGDFAYANGAGTNTRLAGNATGTKMFMQETSSVPSWAALVAADIPSLDASKITTGAFGIAQLPSLSGDTTGTLTANTNVKIQGNAVLAGVPSNGQVYAWSTANSRFEATTPSASTVSSVSGSGGSTGLTLTGGPTGAVTLTLGGTLAVANGGTGQTTPSAAFNALSPLTTLGDILYGGASGAGTRLAGNASTTPMFLRSTGSAGLATAPTFSQINAATDFTGLTPVVNGGTGAATLTGLLRGNGTSAVTGGATASLTTEVSGILPVANGGSAAATFSAGYLKSPGGTGAFTTQATPIPTADGGTGSSTAAVLVDGSRPLTAAWTAGDFLIKSRNSTVWINGLTMGMFADGTTDNTTAFNTLLATANTNGYRVLYLPSGNYLFNSKPNDIPIGLTIIGDGMDQTNLFRNYNELTSSNGFMTWSGANGAQFGGGIKDLTIYANNTTGGVAVKLTGTATTTRSGWFNMDHVRVSYLLAGSWFRGLFVDGSAITTAGSQGIRDATVRDSFFFGSTDTGNTIYLNNAVNFVMHGGGVFVPVSGRAGITVTGANAANAHSTNVSFQGVQMTGPGDFATDYADFVFGTVKADGNLTISANTTDANLMGILTGTVTNSGVRTYTHFDSASQAIATYNQTSGSARDILFTSSSTKQLRFGLDASDNGWIGASNATPFSLQSNGVKAIYIDGAGIPWLPEGSATVNTAKLGGTLFTQTATVTVANSVAETTILGAGSGTLTIPANTFAAGRTLRIRIKGTIGNTATPTLHVRTKVGAQISDMFFTMSAVAGPAPFTYDLDLTCRTAGAGGTFGQSATFLYGSSASGATGQFWQDTSTLTPSIDTTAAKTIDITAQWGAASASNTISAVTATVELLN